MTVDEMYMEAGLFGDEYIETLLKNVDEKIELFVSKHKDEIRDVEDFYQDIRLRALEAVKSGKKYASISSLLHSAMNLWLKHNSVAGECSIFNIRGSYSDTACFSGVERRQLHQELAKTFDLVSPRNSAIVRMKYGFDTGVEMDYEEVGRKFNISGYRVSQICDSYIRACRHPRVSKNLRSLVQG